LELAYSEVALVLIGDRSIWDKQCSTDSIISEGAEDIDAKSIHSLSAATFFSPPRLTTDMGRAGEDKSRSPAVCRCSEP